MKNWTEFLPNRTNEIRRKGKMLNALEYEVKEAQLRAEYLLKSYTELDLIIKDEAIKFNTTEEIEKAVSRSENYNNRPLKQLKNVNK